jgi:FixJ family two-component response regulator
MECSTVFVIDSIAESREATARILFSERHRVLKFETAEAFLADRRCNHPGCLLVDVHLPGLGGIGLQDVLKAQPCPQPVIFLTEKCDVQTSVAAMKAGAIDFLLKSTSARELLAAVRCGIWCDSERRKAFELRASIQHRVDALTPRERDVMTYVIRGKLNKQIAAVLGTGEQNVKMHRARMMLRMRARSVPELVQMGALVGMSVELTQKSPSDAVEHTPPWLRWSLTSAVPMMA